MNTSMNANRANPFVIEKGQRLSRSMLWDLQRSFFTKQGVGAWRCGIVPHYITSNPFIADAYAHVVLGFLRDCQFGNILLDRSQPLYIVELGAGSGRFSFHFLKKFQKLFPSSGPGHINVKYIMTDFAESTCQFWRTHSRLKPFAEQGRLAFGLFDAAHDREITLCDSGEILSQGTVRNPLIVLANYFLDSIPQDLFYLDDGRLFEGLITVVSTQDEPDPITPDLLNRMEIGFDRRPIEGDYYDDQVCNEILHEYLQRLTDTVVVFPCDAIRCMRHLSALSGGRMLLLAADTGYNREEDLWGCAEPAINVHGSFSIRVNFHALGRYAIELGGQVLHTAHGHESLNVSALILGHSGRHIVETRKAFDDAIEKFSPDDYFTLKKSMEKAYDLLSLHEILTLLRWSGWDPNVFLGALPALSKLLKSATGNDRPELCQALLQVWDNYYPIGEESDLGFHIGTILYRIDYYRDALEFFQHSLRLYGPRADTACNMGMCHYMLGERDAALKCVDQALQLDPDLEAAKSMRVEIVRPSAPPRSSRREEI
jgi:hypothetical protein